MIDRINLILKAKNITARQFAEEIGVQASNMSHILTGRHRPSLDFVMKVVNRYPEIDIKWLTLGEGEMYAPSYSMPSSTIPSSLNPVVPAPKTEVEIPVATPTPSAVDLEMPISASDPEPDLFSNQASLFDEEPEEIEVPEMELDGVSEELEPAPVPSQPLATAPAKPASPQPVENRVNESRRPMVRENANLGRKHIVKMVILYDDHSFSEYYPE